MPGSGDIIDKKFNVEAAEGMLQGVRIVANVDGKEVRNIVTRQEAMKRAAIVNAIAKEHPEWRDELLPKVAMIIDACNESRKLNNLPGYQSQFVTSVLSQQEDAHRDRAGESG